MPTYNRAEYIVETLDSVFAQTYRPIELLVVDDGSADNTLNVLNEWQMRHGDDLQFKTIVLKQSNKGACAARNYGFKESSGEFIQFLDSDDTLHPEKIALQVEEFLESPELDMVYASAKWLGTNEDAYLQNRMLTIAESLICAARAECGFFWTASPLFRRSVVEKIGGWDEKKIAMQDVDFGVRFFQLLPKYRFEPDAVVFIRSYEDDREQITRSLKTLPTEYWTIRFDILKTIWKKMPQVLRDNDQLREAVARNTSYVVLRLLERDCMVDKVSAENILREASKGTGFAAQANFFLFLTRLIGIAKASQIYRALESVYANLISSK